MRLHNAVSLIVVCIRTDLIKQINLKLEKTMNNTLSITEYSLLDYSLKLQDAVEKGYRISDSVEGSPLMVGFVYTATLMKREAEVVDELTVKVKIDTTELQEQLKQGGDIEQVTEAALVVEDKVEETVIKTPSKRGRK